MAEPTERTGLKSDQVEIAMVDQSKAPPPDKNSPPPSLPTSARACSLPILFERAARSWWNPKFDSDLLEAQHLRSALPQSQQRFRYALGYVVLSCAVWCAVFGAQGREHWIAFIAGSAALLVVMLVVLGFTFTSAHARFLLPTSVGVTVILCVFSLLWYIYPDDRSSLSEIGLFVGAVEIIMMMYTLIPLPLYLCVGVGVCYSIVFEALYAAKLAPVAGALIACRVLLHFCVHVIGTHVFIMSQVRKHSTFLKVGQSILARRDLQVEKQQKRNMIHSLMPPKVAEEVMKAREDRDRDADELDQPGKSVRGRQGGSGAPEKGKIVFRTFHMSQLDNVTILYADIVGFTKMSSNKSAVLLVRLLNDLFGRFDDICTRTGCEKISTLGDCYYCVSGCPEPRPDHARCCVEMGRAMCVAIKEFDEEHNEESPQDRRAHATTAIDSLLESMP